MEVQSAREISPVGGCADACAGFWASGCIARRVRQREAAVTRRIFPELFTREIITDAW